MSELKHLTSIVFEVCVEMFSLVLTRSAAWSHLWCYGSELVVAEQVEFSSIRVAAEVQSFIPVDREAKNTQEEHPNRAEEQRVELADDCGRPELEHNHR